MIREDIHILFRQLGVPKIKDGREWIRSSCPLAKWTHTKGTDNNPSFGIRIGKSSSFFCFSCNRSGRLSYLPTLLGFLSGRDYPKIREFVNTHESFDLGEYEEEPLGNKTAPSINEKEIEKLYPLLNCKWRGLTARSIKFWGIRYDEKKDRVLFLTYDSHSRLVGIKGRARDLASTNAKYWCYSDYTVHDPKFYGAWYGMHIPLIPNKALILVEGEFNAVVLKQTGLVHNVWASGGASISKEQLHTLMSYLNQPIILFFDDDMAGKAATKKIISFLGGLVSLYRIKDYFFCNDPAELILKGAIKSSLKTLDKIF